MLQESHEKARRVWVLVLASLASFMVALDATVVATALTTIHRDLGVSIANLEWTVNAYTLSFAVLLIPAAALGDRSGRRRMFVAGLLLFVGASAACALAHNIGWLIAARTIQGCGAAVVAPLALTLLSAAFPSEQRARALGIFGSISGLALIAGPVVGGIIAQGLAWQWIFWLNVPIGLLVVALVLGRVQESFGPRTPLDLGGLLSVSGAALGLVWGLVRGSSVGWGSFEVVATLVAGGLLAIVFVAWELRARAPMVPMHFFRSRAFSAGNVAIFLQTTSLVGVVFFMAQFFQVAQGNGPLGAGLRLLPLTATLFVVAPLAGALVNRIGEQVLVAGGLLLQATGIAWIGLVAAPGLPYGELIAPLIIAGCGASFSLPATQNAVINAVRAGDIGKASGAFSMFRQLGSAFGVAILAAVFAATGSLGSAQAFNSGFARALSVAAALSLLGAIIGLVLPGRQVKESKPAEQNPRGARRTVSFLKPSLGKGIGVVIVLAFASGGVLLANDLSWPIFTPFAHAPISAVPLLLIGLAALGFQFVVRPSLLDLFKACIVSTAFLLWGIDQLLPAGWLATTLGDVVIVLYVIDLGWMMVDRLKQQGWYHYTSQGMVSSSPLEPDLRDAPTQPLHILPLRSSR